jgi:hypothetical protein
MIMSANGKSWLPSNEPLFFIAAMMIFAGGSYLFLSGEGVNSGQWAKERALCDHAVNTLLTTKGLVELQRSVFLIRRLDCGITRRL